MDESSQSGGDGAERAVRLAIADAGLEPGDIGYVNAHGTGTDLNDKTEGMVISRVFGSRQPAVSSVKAYFSKGFTPYTAAWLITRK